MPNFAVLRRGSDTSGRPVYETAWFWKCWDLAIADPRLDSIRTKIIIVQGGWMERVPGGGASASVGYHNKAGCIDVRTWNLTSAEIDLLIEVMSDYGIQFWRRTAAQGFDPHAHAIFPSDEVKADGAKQQAYAVLNNHDGLASNGPDYERHLRVLPIKSRPKPEQLSGGAFMPGDVDKILAKIHDEASTTRDLIKAKAGNEAQRDQKLRAQFGEMTSTLGSVVDQLSEITNDVADDATKDQLRKLRQRILSALTAAEDVDGPDNPA